MKKISFIIPSFNEEGNVEQLHKEVSEITKSIANYEFEYIFVENGSLDKTLEILLKLKNLDSSIKILKLSRNFNMDGGIAAGCPVEQWFILMLDYILCVVIVD